MEKTNQYSGYKGIFKSTFLFGIVQIFRVIIGIVRNKAVAILLGAEGMGIMGIYSSTISLLKTGAGLGISQSAVRDISEANGLNNISRFSKTISVTNKVLLISSLLGVVITIVLSPWLSEWTMGDKNYTIPYIILSLVVGVTILSEGQLAILKGMRQLKSLAKATMIGSVVGLFTVVPLFFFFGKSGIVPSLIITALSALFFSYYYVRKIKYKKLTFSLKEVFYEASPMVRMGIALMFTSFLWSGVALIISAYIRSKGGFDEVGFYQAGTTILSRYFGVVITALSTDYYPRIAAINKDNKLLQEELNKQSAVSLVLTTPLIIFFLFLLPVIVPILYSNEFYPTIDFLKYAMFGTIITMISNQVDMILVAKFQIKLFTTLAVVIRILQLTINIVLYNYFGLIGLGLSLAIMGVVHLLIMTTIVYKSYGIRLNSFFIKLASITFLFAISAVVFSEINNDILRYLCGVILSISSLYFTFIISKKYLEMDLLKLFIEKIKK